MGPSPDSLAVETCPRSFRKKCGGMGGGPAVRDNIYEAGAEPTSLLAVRRILASCRYSSAGLAGSPVTETGARASETYWQVLPSSYTRLPRRRLRKAQRLLHVLLPPAQARGCSPEGSWRQTSWLSTLIYDYRMPRPLQGHTHPHAQSAPDQSLRELRALPSQGQYGPATHCRRRDTCMIPAEELLASGSLL